MIDFWLSVKFLKVLDTVYVSQSLYNKKKEDKIIKEKKTKH